MDFLLLNNDYEKYKDKIVELTGFIKANRTNANIGFLMLNDGTTFNNIQIVYNNKINNFDELKSLRLYGVVKVSGKVILTPNNKQPFEILADNIEILKNNIESYPLQKKEHSFEFLREIAHLRPRTKTFWSIMKVRSVLAQSIHNFFSQKNFIWVSSPIITSNDGEGAGETFFVTLNDEKEKFFNQDVALSVTGQLQAEAYAQAFKKVYTFGPTFRAEKSHTNRHAAEFWMLEPEVAFADLNDNINLMQELVVFLVNEYITKCKDEYELFCNLNAELKNNIDTIVANNFQKVSYTEVIDILLKAKNKENFENNNIFWGMDLASEHERYICEKVYNCPVFVYNYPKDIKAFYMKLNNDNKTVAAVDLLIPGVGELIGGSQREDDYDKLLKRCNELKMDIAPLEWYLELRKYGYYMSSGFGLGFERLIMFFTGINNIRDVIPFPRTHGQIKF